MSAHTNSHTPASGVGGGGVGSCMISQLSNLTGTKSRFPRLQECAHFHYEVSTVDIPKNFEVIMCYDNNESSLGDSSVSPLSSTNAAGPATSSLLGSGGGNGGSSVPKPTVNTGSNSSTNCLTSGPNSNGGLAPNNSSGPDSNNIWFHLQVTSHDKKWIINRTYENFRYLDKFLHDCIFDRKFSGLEEPACNPSAVVSCDRLG